MSFQVNKLYLCIGAALSLSVSNAVMSADQGVTFTDIIPMGLSGIEYERQPSRFFSNWDGLRQSGGTLSPMDLPGALPANGHGSPGISVFDYDNDGDLDFYVSNGPGKSSSLYSSQLVETGALSFMDVAVEAGVALPDRDTTGSCYGDIDNDGDTDLLVVAEESANYLFENLGDGTFGDISMWSDIGDSVMNSVGCTMGDINNDGYLDIAVGNSFEGLDNRIPLMMHGFDERRQFNKMYLNTGFNEFVDVSEESGINNFNGITWGVALVDYDLDGDVDFVTGDDQGPKNPAKYDGKDVGWIRVYDNDGHGNFTDRSVELGTNLFGAWMGLSFGDLNHDGNMDIFGPNVGDYLGFAVEDVIQFPPVLGEWSSSIFFGQDDGKFVRDSTNQLGATVFGWGSSITDYDNDGDTDLIFYGGLDMGTYVDGSNPGTVLQNNGNGNFSYDGKALAESTDHNRRTVKGVVMNDLNDDGYVDIVSVSAEDWPEEFPVMPYIPNDFGSVFDDVAQMWPTMQMVEPGNFMAGFISTGMDPSNGSLAVEVSNADNLNGWAKVTLLGGMGITPEGKVNRNAVGAVAMFTPASRRAQMRPLVVGASYASAENLENVFGLGDDFRGTLEVIWPGGVKTKLFDVFDGDRLNVPEIPCSYDNVSLSYTEYRSCVFRSLRDNRVAGNINFLDEFRIGSSALRARLLFLLENGIEE